MALAVAVWTASERSLSYYSFSWAGSVPVAYAALVSSATQHSIVSSLKVLKVLKVFAQI